MRNRKKLYIIGASNLGRELESWLDLIPEEKRDWEIKGYLHAFVNESPLNGYPSGYSILGSWEDFVLQKSDYCILAVSDSSWKERIYLHLKDKVTFFTYIAPSAIIGKFTSIGEGSIICPNCIISTNVHLGVGVLINLGTQIGHDSKIGDFCSIMPSVNLGGNVSIGRKIFIGTNSVIIPNIKVGEESTIGAGSVVINKIQRGTTVFGNPAKKI